MPYIDKSRREFLDPPVYPLNPGELNYCITMLVNGYLGDSPSYRHFNAVVGVLECAKLELYRRKVVPYEDKKITENGDVY